AIDALRMRVRKALEKHEYRLVVLSDRSMDRDQAAIPTLLAVGVVHTELVEMGARIQCDIVCEAGDVRDVHQFACVLGFGANAVYPYLAYDIIRKIVLEPAIGEEGDKDTAMVPLTPEKAIRNYGKAITAGLLKIMS